MPEIYVIKHVTYIIIDGLTVFDGLSIVCDIIFHSKSVIDNAQSFHPNNSLKKIIFCESLWIHPFST